MSRQYLNVAKVIDGVILDKRSFKSICANMKIGKAEYALAAETLKSKHILDKLFLRCQVSADKLDVRYSLLLCMAYELLFGKKKIQSGGVVKRKLKEIEPDLRKELCLLLDEENHKHLQGTDDISYSTANNKFGADRTEVKYVRVNEVKVSKEQAIAVIQKFCPEAFFDNHISTLICLPNSHKGLGEYDFVKNGQMIIQDKSSCFPSQILGDCWISNTNPLKTSTEVVNWGDIIDGCSAPGNKTSHLANFLHTFTILNFSDKPTSKFPQIFAFEKNAKRFQLLTQRMNNAGVTHIVKPTHADFLLVDPLDPLFSNVKYCLMDPSCSGSGLVSIDRLVERSTQSTTLHDSSEKDHRVLKLKEFQISVLLHSFKFPNVQYVVYSTCSIHKEENEEVVAEVLKQANEDINSSYIWNVLTPTNMTVNEWKRRGEACEGLTHSQQEALIRCSPEDMTSGFFVSLFHKTQRISSNSTAASAAATSASTLTSSYAKTHNNPATIEIADQLTVGKKRTSSYLEEKNNHKLTITSDVTANNTAAAETDTLANSKLSLSKKSRVNLTSSHHFSTFWKPWNWLF